MDFFTISSLFCLVLVCTSASDNALTKSENILDLKSDVDKINDGLENLAFDILDQVMAKVNIFQVYGDYPTGDKVETPTDTAGPHTINKSITEDVENTTEEYSAGKSMEISLETSTATANNGSGQRFPKKRPRRSATRAAAEKIPVPQPQTPPCDVSSCPEKTLKEQVLEQKHIEDLKEEVNKLYDLVLLLRDQQKVISLLRDETTHTENDIPNKFSARNLLKVLDHVSGKEIEKGSGRKSAEIIIEPDVATGKRATHEELENIKNDLREAIAALNRTETILAMQKEKEVYLENQLQDQRLQINFLNAMVLRLYRDDPNFSVGFHPRKENFTISKDDILGAAMHLPKELPFSKTSRRKSNDDDKINETTSDGHEIAQTSRIREVVDQDQRRQIGARGRASELEDLEKLLEQISKPKKSDMESKMLELQKEMEKKKHDEDLLKQLVMLQKLMAQQKENTNLNGATSSESELIKRLQLAVANKEKPESKLIDDDMELELKKLQVVIENLRPKDQWEIIQNERPKSDSEIFQQMLQKLVKQGNSNMVHKGPQLSPKDIEELVNPKLVNGESTPFPSSDASYGYGYGPQGIFRRLPPFPPQPSSRWYGNAPYYPPFTNVPYPPVANRMLNNNYGMYGASNNAEYSGYFAPTGNVPPTSYQDQHFGPYPSYKPMPMAPSHHNFEPNTDYGSPNIYQKPFGNPMAPPSYSYGPMGPNSYQTQSDINPTIQHNFGMNIDQQGSSDASQRPYVQPLPPNQYNFGSNMDQNNYQGASDSHLIITGPSGYNKPVDQGPKTFPYPEGPMNTQGYKQTDIKTHFFPVYPVNTFQKPISNGFYPQAAAAGESSGQSGTYSPHDTGNVDYRHQKIEDLKRQVYSLQNIIDELNKPDYTQKPEDKETVANLERQITELNGIINGLNQDLAPNKPNYLPSNPPPSYEQSVPQQQPANFEKTSRRRRSLTDNQIDPDEDSKLYDQVVSKVKQFFFEKDNQTEERSSYDDVQRKIADLKYRRPYGITKDWIRTFV